MSASVEAIDRLLDEYRSQLKKPMLNKKRREIMKRIDHLLDRRNQLTRR